MRRPPEDHPRILRRRGEADLVGEYSEPFSRRLNARWRQLFVNELFPTLDANLSSEGDLIDHALPQVRGVPSATVSRRGSLVIRAA